MLFKNLSKKLLCATLAIATVALVVGGCGSSSKDTKPAEQKVLRVGSETTFPPFEFTEGDKYVGFDIDLSQAIAKEMGYTWEFRSMGFDALIPALRAGDIDMIAAGLDPTEERKKVVLFSDPYFTEGGYTVIVRKDNTSIQGFDSLSGKIIGAQIGTKPVDIAKAIPNTTVKEIDSNAQIFMELKAGTIDAIIIDKAVGMYYLKQGADADAKIVGAPTASPGMSLAIAQSNPDLQKKVNEALASLRKSGEYQKIYDKWFSTGQPK